MTQSDPTDNALAAIASILDSPRATSEPPKPPPVPVPPPLPTEQIEAPADELAAPSPAPTNEPEPVEAAPIEAPPVDVPPVEAARPLEANGYSKVGPGPMAALRFKWTAREDNGQYFVDESIGDNGTPLVNGPMDKDAAIRFVDDRAAESHQRFDRLKNEMIERSVPREDDSED